MTAEFLFLAAVCHLIATLVVAGVGIYAIYVDAFRRPFFHFAILAFGIVGGVLMVASGYYLIAYWAVLMEQFDFTEITRGNVNPRRLPSRFHFLPTTSTTLGLVAALLFARLLFRRLRRVG